MEVVEALEYSPKGVEWVPSKWLPSAGVQPAVAVGGASFDLESVRTLAAAKVVEGAEEWTSPDWQATEGAFGLGNCQVAAVGLATWTALG